MTDGTYEDEEGKGSTAVGLSAVESVVMLQPYVAPEHRQLIAKAERMIDEYSTQLLKQIEAELFEHGWNLDPHPSSIREAEIRFHQDPMRQQLMKNLESVKLVCERPRFMLKAT